ncbi:MAG: hypothetical protein CVU04_04790 [Bacteroidetes bacterium HGW-Bacteroidetes-20]|nr:MAG: hypothetical protein CVU04_04790 [Bacteroidetes bacterium HGW-Bacteroidetes-20]
MNNDTIYVTGEHPFFVKNKGWICVKDLNKGDILISHDNIVPIIQSKSKILWKNNVYNIEVNPNHNYYISNYKILIHNK